MDSFCAFCVVGLIAGNVIPSMDLAFNGTEPNLYNSSYQCTENFELVRKEDGFVLNGVIETPSIGHEYAIHHKDGNTYDFFVRNNQLVALQAIESLPIDYELEGVVDTSKPVVFMIDKVYGWGPDEITCKVTSDF